MKRFAVFLTMLALLVPLMANAAIVRHSEQLHFQHRAAATATPLGITDSAFVTHTGAITDTTEAFYLEKWAFTPYVLGADSLSLMDLRLVLKTATALTVAADSIYVTLQGSYDGDTWDSAPQVGILESGNGAAQMFFKGYATTRLGSVTAAATTNLQMGAYRVFRFIIQTSAADKGRLFAYASWWKND